MGYRAQCSTCMRVNTDPEAAKCPACGSRRLVVLSPAPRVTAPVTATPKKIAPPPAPRRIVPPEARAKARQLLAAHPKPARARKARRPYVVVVEAAEAASDGRPLALIVFSALRDAGYQPRPDGSITAPVDAVLHALEARG